MRPGRERPGKLAAALAREPRATAYASMRPGRERPGKRAYKLVDSLPVKLQ